MKKKLLLILGLVLGVFTQSAFAQSDFDEEEYEQEENFKYAVGGLYFKDVDPSKKTVKVCTQFLKYGDPGEVYYQAENEPKGEITVPATITHNNTTYKVVELDYNAFRDCKELTKVTVEEGITVVNPYAFSGCPKLTSVKLPSTIENIFDYAFSKSSALVEVNLPEGLKKLGEYIFADCSSLSKLYLEFETPSQVKPNGTSGKIFHSAPIKDITLVVPDGTGEAFKADNFWKMFSTIVEKSGLASIHATQAQQASVKVEQKTAVVTLTSPQAVLIYSPQGTILYQGVQQATSQAYALPLGLSLIKVGTEIFKVLN